MNPFADLIARRVIADPVTLPPSETKRLRKNGHQPTSIYLSPAQKAKLRELGGSRWVQQQIDNA